jgi:two-component system response regulator FixJ
MRKSIVSRDLVVHVIDDDIAVRQSLAFLLATAGISARLHDSAIAFLAVVEDVAPGCLVTDIRMPGMDGLQLLRELQRRKLSIPTIVITGHADVPLAVEAMRLGAVDFIEKPFDDDAFLRAIRAGLQRRDEQVRQEAHVSAIQQRLATLSEREEQVMKGLVAGHQNKIIAADLAISPRTVEIYRANLMTKMQAASLPDLVRMAIIAGAIEADPSKA